MIVKTAFSTLMNVVAFVCFTYLVIFITLAYSNPVMLEEFVSYVPAAVQTIQNAIQTTINHVL